MIERKDAARIALGTVVGLLFWAVVVLLIAGIAALAETLRYTEVSDVAAIADDKRYILTGTHTADGLTVSDTELVIRGDLTVKGRFVLENVILVVEGSLTADRIEFEESAGDRARIINRGTLSARTLTTKEYVSSGGGRHVLSLQISNHGNASVGTSNATEYSCGAGSLLEIERQNGPCVIQTGLLAEALAGRRNIEVDRFENYEISVMLNTGGAYIVYRWDRYFNAAETEARRTTAIAVLAAVPSAFAVFAAVSFVAVWLRDRRRRVGATRFTGGAAAYIGWQLLRAAVGLVTAGMTAPYLDAAYYRWAWKHTMLDGRQLRFDGRGGQIFWRNMRWMLLTLVTAGVYAFWALPAYARWIAENTHYDDPAEGDSAYSGTPRALFRVAAFAVLRTAAVLAGYFLLPPLITAVAWGGVAVVTILATILGLFALLFFAAVWLPARVWNDALGITVNRTVTDGRELHFAAIPIKWFLGVALLSLVTCGGYALVLPYRLYTRTLENRVMS